MASVSGSHSVGRCLLRIRLQWLYQLRLIVPHIPHSSVDREPFELPAGRALVQEDLLCAVRCGVQVDPFAGKLGAEHDRAAVVRVDYPALSVGGDDHEAVCFLDLPAGRRELANSSEEQRVSSAQPDVIGLLDLCQRGEYTDDLFAPTQPEASRQVMAVLDAVNAKWGRGALRPGVVPPTQGWGMKREMMSRSFTTRLDQLWRVLS